jgi:hypothetical protein
MLAILSEGGASAEQIGLWVLALGVLAHFALSIKKLFWPDRPHGEQAATRQELEALEGKLRCQIDETAKDLKALEGKLQGRIDAALAQVESHKDRTAEAINETKIKLEALRAEVLKEIDTRMTRLEVHIGEHGLAIARLVTLLERQTGSK